MKTTKQTVLEYFNGKGGLPGSTEEEQLSCYYLDEKIIDSMGIIEMISYFEETFGIFFDSEAIQSQEIQCVGGLIEMIEKLRAEAL